MTELDQQAVTTLRPSDQIKIIQNGVDKLMLVQALTETIITMITETVPNMAVAAHNHVPEDVNGLPSQIAALVNAVNGKSPMAHAHPIDDILDNFIDGTTNLATVYNDCFPVIKQATVANGNAVFHFTEDSTPGGAPVFETGPLKKSEMFRAQEGTNPHAFGTSVWSNSDKTLTLPVSRTGAAVSLLGISVLGANAPANGSLVYAIVWGR